ncbi:hypothetical protein HUU51_05100 [Candidatus Gracilibacteria bacterium]|nr:hypothetical protein [Candidatus Gracilibacteria bacterium]
MFLHSPDFLIFSVLVLFMILYLVFKVIDVVNNTKKRKSLERIVNFFVVQGDITMKNLFAKAVAQVDAAHAAQPISGNEEVLSSIFAKVYKRSQEQGFVLAQLISAKSFVEAANKQQGEINEIIDAVKAELSSESCRFDANTKAFLQNALAKGPDEFVKGLQQVAAQQTEAPTQAEAATVEQAKVVQLVSPVAEAPVVDNEEELKLLLANITWLPVKLPEEPYSIMGLPASTFDRLWGAFNVRLHKTSEEQRVAQLLDEVKSIRDGEPAKKVGGNNSTPGKSCGNMQLFLFF